MIGAVKKLTKCCLYFVVAAYGIFLACILLLVSFVSKFKYFIFTILTILALYSIIDIQIKISNKNRRLSDLSDKVHASICSNLDLQNELERCTDDENIKKIAHEKLNMTYPSERVFVDVATE